MNKNMLKKCLSLVLVCVMLIGTLQLTSFAEDGSVTNYEDFISYLKALEGYADTYAAATFRDPGELVLNFIRTGVERYRDDSWNTIAGAEIVGFTDYVKAQDEENNTSAMNLRNIVTSDFILPNGNQVDFGHMFGTMNISYISSGSADLSGWAGDLCDLLYYCVDKTSVPSGTVEEMAAYIGAHCFGVDADDAFGWDDFYGDMDAYYLVNEFKKGTSALSDLMQAYFTEALTNENRAVYFVNSRFAVEDSKDAVRKAIYESYSNDVSIKLLESGRGLTSYNNLRQACCYAFADYLYDLAKGQLVEGTEDNTETDNDYYTVFSTESSVLAPGIEQKINYAQTVDGKQIVYYVATVDVTRDDVTIMANYKDNDPSLGWGYQRVQEQAEALVKNHAGNYENFNVIVATNADGYNMATGEPGGLLVMDGKEWHAVDGDGFFAILKDGSAMIGTKADYETYKDQIQEAVGGFGAVLVKDGKINVTKNANYAASRASRTAIGIKADGSVVMMVLDGRQLPFSAGGAMEEIAQIMLDAGCVHAINLDGGGSTTYLSKPAGSDKLQLTNRPSDGYARSVSTSLVAVSTAKSSNEFDHAIISSDYDFITPYTEMQMTVTGVSNTGNAAVIPDGAYWRVSDESIGSIDENGLFTAYAYGTVTVEFVVNNEVVGQKMLEVVVPDNIEFAEDRITAIYGEPAEIEVTVWHKGSPVAFTPWQDTMLVFSPGFDDEGNPIVESDAGSIEGMIFTGTDANGIRIATIIAALQAGEDVIFKTATINLYYDDEASFDFENATMGNRTLAWNREVTNARTADNRLYRIVDPTSPITMSYTFSLDLSVIDMPTQLEPLKSMLPGADTGATAWDFLLQLAERVCELTTVKITADFSPALEVDISNLELINEYFTLTSATIDEETNRLTVIVNWVDQTAAIDPSTANSLCILSGLTATVKDDAVYNNNELLIANNGTVTYDIYLAASQLASFAQDETNQKTYGLYPYEHVPACRTDGNDKGGHFSSTYAEFADIYVLNSEIRKGWVEDSYYVDNEPVTGIQLIPSRKHTNEKCFYEFDEDGLLIRSLSGLIEYDDNNDGETDLYHAADQKLTRRWASLTDDDRNTVYYYFDPTTYKAVDGVQQINEGIIFTYTFENNVLVKGDLRSHTYTDNNGQTHSGTGYRWAGNWMSGQWFEYEGASYYLPTYTYIVATGVNYWSSAAQAVPETGYYLFDENGVFLNDRPRIYNDMYFNNGMAYEYSYRLVEVDGYYYYVDGKTLKIHKNEDIYINEVVSRGYVPAGTYTFDEYGRLVKELVNVNTDGIELESCTVVGRVVTIKNDTPCNVGYLENGVYVIIEPVSNGDGSYSYQLSKDVSEIVVVVKGNIDGKGDVDATDVLTLILNVMGLNDMDAKQQLAADINGDGKITVSDIARLYAAVYQTKPLKW